MQNRQTILIVDDIKENIDILVKLLDKYDLITALNGESALEILEEEEIDLILLDIMMPEMDGFEVCKRVKSKSKTLNTPIIFLSAKNRPEDIERGFKLGGVDYVTKPFNPNELLARVKTHLKLRSYEKNLELQVQQEIEKNRQTQDMIHQQSKQAALGELLMHIAHQWKQPLTALNSINLIYSSYFEREIDIDKEEFKRRVQKSEDLISFMSQTVTTFINFYEPSYNKRDFLLTTSVNQVLNISEATMKYYNVKIRVTSKETKPTYANENEFTQIIFSIINNARDIFIKREIKNPQIDIAIQNSTLSISDNGGGISQDIIEEIFLPFKSSTGGNGIGLYIAKEIAKKNNAEISVSNGDMGACFRVDFI